MLIYLFIDLKPLAFQITLLLPVFRQRLAIGPCIGRVTRSGAPLVTQRPPRYYYGRLGPG